MSIGQAQTSTSVDSKELRHASLPRRVQDLNRSQCMYSPVRQSPGHQQFPRFRSVKQAARQSVTTVAGGGVGEWGRIVDLSVPVVKVVSPRFGASVTCHMVTCHLF